MRVAAIIAEYNPFHNGHAHHIAATRALGYSHIIAIMGGNFTQRGEAAIFDKRLRARAALLGGADMVIELPLPYATATAERFAFGAVKLAAFTGVVDALSFGAEDSDTTALERIAALLQGDEIYTDIRAQLAAGVTFAAARQLAVAERLGAGAAALLEKPNNILAVEYLRHLASTDIEPVAIPRHAVGHNSATGAGEFASASLVRSLIWEGGAGGRTALGFVPHEARELYEGAIKAGAYTDPARADASMLAVLRRSPEALFAVPDVSEGIENRLLAALNKTSSMEQAVAAAKTKRYTHTRIKRLYLAAYLGVPAELQAYEPPYLRIIGVKRAAGELHARLAQCAQVPVVTAPAKLRGGELCERFLNIESRATDLFNATLHTPRRAELDYRDAIAII